MLNIKLTLLFTTYTVTRPNTTIQYNVISHQLSQWSRKHQ